jgi:hypothetical protein
LIEEFTEVYSQSTTRSDPKNNRRSKTRGKTPLVIKDDNSRGSTEFPQPTTSDDHDDWNVFSKKSRPNHLNRGNLASSHSSNWFDKAVKTPKSHSDHTSVSKISFEHTHKSGLDISGSRVHTEDTRSGSRHINHDSKSHSVLHLSGTQSGSRVPSEALESRSRRTTLTMKKSSTEELLANSIDFTTTVANDKSTGQSLFLDIPLGREDVIDRLIQAAAIRCYIPDFFPTTKSPFEAYTIYLQMPLGWL